MSAIWELFFEFFLFSEILHEPKASAIWKTKRTRKIFPYCTKHRAITGLSLATIKSYSLCMGIFTPIDAEGTRRCPYWFNPYVHRRVTEFKTIVAAVVFFDLAMLLNFSILEKPSIVEVVDVPLFKLFEFSRFNSLNINKGMQWILLQCNLITAGSILHSLTRECNMRYIALLSTNHLSLFP